MKRPNLTPKQADVYRLIVEGCNDGKCPTMKEIGQALGISKVTAFGHIGDLLKKGYIERVDSFKARNLSPIAPVDLRYINAITQEQARNLLEAAERLIAVVEDSDQVWLDGVLDGLGAAIEDIKASAQPPGRLVETGPSAQAIQRRDASGATAGT